MCTDSEPLPREGHPKLYIYKPMIFACMFPQEQMESGKIGDQDKKKKRTTSVKDLKGCVCVCMCVF